MKSKWIIGHLSLVSVQGLLLNYYRCSFPVLLYSSYLSLTPSPSPSVSLSFLKSVHYSPVFQHCVGKIESDVRNSILQIEKMMTLVFFPFFSECWERWPWLQALVSLMWKINDGLHNLCSGPAFWSCLYWFPSKRLLWRRAPTSRCSSSQPTCTGSRGRRPHESMWTLIGRRER